MLREAGPATPCTNADARPTLAPAAGPDQLLPVLRSVNPNKDSTTPTRMYGYLRLPEQAPEAVLTGWCGSMRTYANRNGYRLVTIFCDVEGGAANGFDALVAELKATSGRHVIVPDLERLHSHPLIRQTRIDKLLDGLEVCLHYGDR
jgi:hypothetical protein